MRDGAEYHPQEHIQRQMHTAEGFNPLKNRHVLEKRYNQLIFEQKGADRKDLEEEMVGGGVVARQQDVAAAFTWPTPTTTAASILIELTAAGLPPFFYYRQNLLKSGASLIMRPD